MQEHPLPDGNVRSSPCFLRYGDNHKGTRVPFGALVDVLPYSAINDKERSQMSPRTVTGFLLGDYENVHGLTMDYVVIPRTLLTDATCPPNERHLDTYTTTHW